MKIFITTLILCIAATILFAGVCKNAYCLPGPYCSFEHQDYYLICNYSEPPGGDICQATANRRVLRSQEECFQRRGISETGPYTIGHLLGLNYDSDCDGIPDDVEDADYDCVQDPRRRFRDNGSIRGETGYLTPDSDHDGIPDGREDSNRNGIYEPQLGETDPLDSNSPIHDPDFDGLPEPITDDVDSDNDGLPDTCERLLGTNPYSPDTDGDALMDGEEDFDNDCRIDRSPGETDPRLPDTDQDGLNDNIEIAYATDPWNQDTDGDCIKDGQEDSDHNGRFDSGETNALMPDTDADGLSDGFLHGQGEDKNCNGHPDFFFGVTGIDTTETDPAKWDTDGDMLSDYTERYSPYTACNGRAVKSNPVDTDTDRDGWNDWQERTNWTDPTVPDTDGDGLVDSLDPCPCDADRNSSCTPLQTVCMETDGGASPNLPGSIAYHTGQGVSNEQRDKCWRYQDAVEYRTPDILIEHHCESYSPSTGRGGTILTTCHLCKPGACRNDSNGNGYCTDNWFDYYPRGNLSQSDYLSLVRNEGCPTSPPPPP